MKVSMDILTYKASFSAARQYNFYVKITFPGVGNILQAASKGLMAGGMSGFTKESISQTGISTATSTAMAAMDALKMGGGMKDVSFFVRSSFLPESTFEEVVTSWMGHDYKLAGKQTFNDWTATFTVDKDGLLLRKFWDWHTIIHDPESNNYGNPTSYMTDQEVHLISSETGETVTCYKLYGAWPKQIGQVQLDYGNNDVATVDITFAYQYHTVTEKEPNMIMRLLKRTARSFVQSGGISTISSMINKR